MILDLILELKAEGSTVLYTTHYMAEAEELSDRVGIIDHGRLLAIGTCKELAQDIGGQESVLLQLSSEEDSGRLVQELEGVPGLKAASDGARVTVAATRVGQLLPRIVEAAASIRASLRDIEIREPNLETVFLAYTGRALAAPGGEA